MARRREVIRCLVQKATLFLCEELSDMLLEDLSKEKRVWVRKWLSRRNERGASSMLLKELAIEDEEEYRNSMRMTKQQFQQLLNKITSTISKSDTIMRDAIPAQVKLEITLSYLATGNSYRSLQQHFRVSRPAISKFIPEVCDAIYENLKEYMKVPNIPEEWKEIENGFRQRWNFPHCYGAIDGKHVNIRAPANCGSEFFNYKGVNSIILLAVVDHDYCFRYVNVGCNGKQSDGGVFQNSSLFDALENNLLPTKGFLVGDDAFPLKTYLMKPYSKITLSKKQKIFNYRLSRARRIVENAFGILAGRFRIFEKPIACLPSTVDKIIRACCTLHNWMRKTPNNTYISRGYVDEEDIDNGEIIPGLWRQKAGNGWEEIPRIGSNRSSQKARAIRDEFCQYFVEEGAVPWQDRMIF